MPENPDSASSDSEFPPEHILVGPRAGWILSGLFLLLLAVPPLVDGLPDRFRDLAGTFMGKGSSQPIAGRLRDYDARVASAPLTDVPRQWTQEVLSTVLNKGNDRVVIGKDHWLFYRPEIQALTGFGPIQTEPHSVSRDPALLDWAGPLEPILHFADQLMERGVALWIVPVPMKPGIYPEMLGGRPSDGPVRHRDAARFFQTLESAGIRVVDLAPSLWAAKTSDAAEGPVYLKDDTHWSSRGMMLSARLLAEAVKQESWWTAPAGDAWLGTLTPSLPDHGDLVEKLGLLYPDRWATPRVEPLHVVEPPPGVIFPDRNSPLVLLGDSFVNIFDDAGLGFQRPDESANSRAGLAWNFGKELGMAPDVYAVNGDGATGVRRWLAQRGESVVRSKKLVIWVIAERDLFLSRTVAKANQVTWEQVSIAADPPVGTPPPLPDQLGNVEPIIVEAEALELAEQPDPRRANYENALFTIRYQVGKVISGKLLERVIEAEHWLFKKRELQPASRIEAGLRYRLTLEPWSRHPELLPVNRSELSDAAPLWWVTAFEKIPP